MTPEIRADEAEVQRRVEAALERARPSQDLPEPPLPILTEIERNRRSLRFDRRR